MDAATCQPLTDATDLSDFAGPTGLTDSAPAGDPDDFDRGDIDLADLRPEMRLLVVAWRLQKRLDDLSSRIDRAREALSGRCVPSSNRG